jgi:hypothetical protein
VAYLTLKERNIPFLNYIKYLGVISDKRVTWRMHIETTITLKAFRTFIRVYPLFKSERLTFHKALIMPVMTYVCLAWHFAADTSF